MIIGPPTVTPIYTSPSPSAYVAPSSVSYYAAPEPVIATPVVVPRVVTAYSPPTTSYYYAPAPVVAYYPTVVVRRPRVVRYYYGSPVYIYP